MATAPQGGIEEASAIVVPQHVVFRSFASETVMLNIETGQYHGLNPVAGRMLEVLEAATTIGEAVDNLVAEFAQPRARIREDLLEFCSGLLHRGLIDIRA
jgi:hypothetical protein